MFYLLSNELKQQMNKNMYHAYNIKYVWFERLSLVFIDTSEIIFGKESASFSVGKSSKTKF